MKKSPICIVVRFLSVRRYARMGSIRLKWKNASEGAIVANTNLEEPISAPNVGFSKVSFT